MRLPDPPLLLITDRAQAKKPLLDVVEEAFVAGCRWVSLREKDMAPQDRHRLLRDLVAVAERYDATVGIHDDFEGMAIAGVGALHLPAGGTIEEARRCFGHRLLLGISVHSVAEAGEAARRGADYVTFGPVFESLSKPGYGKGTKIAGLAEAASGAHIPVVALGGVRPANARDCMAAGAAGVAVMGAVMATQHPGEQVAALLKALRPAGS